MSTTLPRRASAVSGGELSHPPEGASERSSPSPVTALTALGSCSGMVLSPTPEVTEAPSPPASSAPTRSLFITHPARNRKPCLLTGGPSRLLDQPDNHLRVRDERHVTRLHLGHPCVHALGVEALEIRIDGLVVLRNQVPRWNGLPRGLRNRSAEGGADDRLLGRGQDPRLPHRAGGGKKAVGPPRHPRTGGRPRGAWARHRAGSVISRRSPRSARSPRGRTRRC